MVFAREESRAAVGRKRSRRNADGTLTAKAGGSPAARLIAGREKG